MSETNTITISQCRELRELMLEFTSECILTQEEYLEILNVLSNAIIRLDKESKC